MPARNLIAGLAKEKSLKQRLEDIEGTVRSGRVAGIKAKRLSDIAPDLGIIESGEFRVGNGAEPGAGFTGGRFTWPGITISGSNFFLAGFNNDNFQVGLSIDKGTFVGGSANALGQPKVIIDGQSIKLTSDNIPSIRWIEAASNGSKISTGIYSIDGTGYTFWIDTNQDLSGRISQQTYRARADGATGGCYVEMLINASAPAVDGGTIEFSGIPTTYFKGITVGGGGSFTNGIATSGTLNVQQALTAGASRTTVQASAFLNLQQGGTLVIASASITVKGSRHRVDGSGAATQTDLEGINGLNDGDMVILQTVNGARDVKLRHNTTNGNLALSNNTDRIMSGTTDMFVGIYNSDASKVSEWGKI